MHKKAAFTMVELIFVIVILGILAAVAVPKLNASREDAKLAAGIANLRVIMNDLRTFYLANGEFKSSWSSLSGVYTDDTQAKACKDAGGSWDTSKNQCRRGSYDITKITNVSLKQKDDRDVGTTVYKYAMSVDTGDDCLEFRIFNDDTLVITPTQIAGDASLCARFLQHESVRSILKGTTAWGGQEPKIVGETDKKPVYFAF